MRQNKALARLRQDGVREMARRFFAASLDRHVEKLKDILCVIDDFSRECRPELPRFAEKTLGKSSGAARLTRLGLTLTGYPQYTFTCKMRILKVKFSAP